MKENGYVQVFYRYEIAKAYKRNGLMVSAK